MALKKRYDEGKLVTFNGFVQILFGLFMLFLLPAWLMGTPIGWHAGSDAYLLCQTICIVAGLVFIYRGIEKIVLWYAKQ